MKLLRLQLTTFFLYISFLLFFAAVGYREEIHPYMIILQIVFAFTFFVFLYYSYKLRLSIKVILLVVFCSSLILSFILRECFLGFTGRPFGPAVDSYGYNDIATKLMRKNIGDLSQYMSSHGYNIDDYGYPYVLYFIYSMAGNESTALYLVLCFNSLAITLSTYYLYRLMKILNIEYVYTHFFSAAWAFFPFLSVTSAVGLKENFFSVFIISSFFYMYKYKRTKKIVYIIPCFISIFACLFFRMAIPVLLLLSFIVLLITNAKNNKRILTLLFFGAVAGALSLNIIFTYIFPFSLEFVLSVANARISGGGADNISFGWLVQILSAMVGPFPNFSRSAAYGIIHNSGLLFKVIFSFPLWIGIWYVIKKLDYKYYALMVYTGLGVIMVTLSGVSLDMRYQITFFPLMLPVIAYAFQNGMHKKYSRVLYGCYIVVSVGLIMVYNNR